MNGYHKPTVITVVVVVVVALIVMHILSRRGRSRKD